MKINWGQGLAIFMVAFMIFILSFVYKTFTDRSYDHHLVSKEYYKDTMNYQQEIDALDNAKKLDTDVVLVRSAKGLHIKFPSDLGEIVGQVQFQKPSNVKLDINKSIKLYANNMLIENDKLVAGLYNVKIRWTANNIEYLYKDKLTY